MRIFSGSAARAHVRGLAARTAKLTDAEPVVGRIIDDVRRDGDAALRKYSEKWDGLDSKTPLRVSESEILAAWQKAPAELKKNLRCAAANIRRFCQWQRPKSWTRAHDGISLGQIVRPLDTVGCYVPGGRHPLVSTLLMTVIPAQVAGVTNIRVVTPSPRAEILAAAALLGVKEVYRVGGAQAIAALAYGTKSISRVDKIVGPGNLYVTAAKKLVSFDCAIDFLAGPTEVVVVSDGGNPEFMAADLVAQAEHDPEAVAIFISTKLELAQKVANEAVRLSRRNEVAQKSLKKNGAILVASSRKESFEWANEIAPEHLTVDAMADVALVRNAGSIFVGNYSPQAAGDYVSGPNHVLPTGGTARFRGGLTVSDFTKVISIQKLSSKGLKRIAPTVESLAMAEGLCAHAESVRMRAAHA